MPFLKRFYLICLLAVIYLTACTPYQAKVLDDKSIAQQQKTPSFKVLQLQANQLKQPLLKKVVFDLSNGLSPDEAAIFAVLNNPELRVIRDKRAIASAQLLQAGLLPNPSIAYNFMNTSGGLDKGKVFGYGLNLDWEVTALLTQHQRVLAAKNDSQAVDLQIAWQEWQVAQAAKLACYQLQILINQEKLLQDNLQRLTSNHEKLQFALAKNLVTVLDNNQASNAQQLLIERLQTITKQKAVQKQRLNRALGLKADVLLAIEQNVLFIDNLTLANYSQLTAHLAEQRLDLLALKQAYYSQDEQVHIAVLKQFPKISIGLLHTKNNSDYYTMGAGISLTLPIFDNNQAMIALATATRQMLFDEYSQRDFQAKADIAELLTTIDSLNVEIKTTQHFLNDLQNLLASYDNAFAQRQIEQIVYYTAWNNVNDKQVALFTLQLRLIEAIIALETATGRYY